MAESKVAAMAVGAHPAGLRTLFFTELWERFSYYGMRAMLVLFMVDSIERGGMGLSDQSATAIYGLYTAAVYLMALPGGYLADRVLGARRAVWYGGIVIMCGHLTLAVPSTHSLWPGLLLVVVGTGLLKPNITTMVGQLYPADDSRRDSGFTLFYMGINIGAFLGPLVCGGLGESRWGWHAGFGCAAVGMFLGLLHYRWTLAALGDAGAAPAASTTRGAWRWPVGAMCGAIGALGLAIALVEPATVARYAASGIAVAMLCCLGWLVLFGGLTAIERRRVAVIGVLCLASALFWSGFEQAGSSLTLFAERYTDRDFLGWELPTTWFQSLNPLLIITLAPPFAWLWIELSRRNMEPGTPAKFALGLLILGSGFAVLAVGAGFASGTQKVAPFWLLSVYLLSTVGELCLSPVGLNAVSKLSPARFTGLMMGIWFLSFSLGNVLAGLLAGRFDPQAAEDMPALFGQIALASALGGLALLAATGRLRRWSEGADAKAGKRPGGPGMLA